MAAIQAGFAREGEAAMLSNPRSGQSVRIVYSKMKRPAACSQGEPLHGRIGRIVIPSRGKPRNHGVKIDGRIVVIPAGQLIRTAPMKCVRRGKPSLDHAVTPPLRQHIGRSESGPTHRDQAADHV